MIMSWDKAQQKAIEDAKRNSEKWQIAFTNPDAFDCLVTILTILKWRGTLSSEADVARHNAAEEIMARFGSREPGQWMSTDQLEAQVRAAMKG